MTVVINKPRKSNRMAGCTPGRQASRREFPRAAHIQGQPAPPSSCPSSPCTAGQGTSSTKSTQTRSSCLHEHGNVLVSIDPIRTCRTCTKYFSNHVTGATKCVWEGRGGRRRVWAKLSPPPPRTLTFCKAVLRGSLTFGKDVLRGKSIAQTTSNQRKQTAQNSNLLFNKSYSKKSPKYSVWSYSSAHTHSIWKQKSY